MLLLSRMKKFVWLGRITPIEGCRVKFEGTYTQPSPSKDQMKHQISKLKLSDFDPEKVTLDPSKDTRLRIERSDGAAIAFDTEWGDGHKSNVRLSRLSLGIGDESNAKKVVATLRHAVTLCGGKAAPIWYPSRLR
jgi:hypothetical protein